jgi:hypothetical protein
MEVVVEGKYFRASGDLLVRPLGETFYGPRRGRVATPNDLARVGLPVADGVVLTDEAHEVFLEDSGVLESVKAAAWRGEGPLQKASEIRLHYGSTPLEAELNRQICQALIGLGAPAVSVLSEDCEKRGLSTIPGVVDAVREAWLSTDGLKWQIQTAAVGEEVPTWPVLIQKEISPVYTGWSTTGTVSVGGAREGKHLSTRPGPLYDVEPVRERAGPERKSIARLTLEAASVLGTNAKIWWGLEGGRWYVLSTVAEDTNSVQRGLL